MPVGGIRGTFLLGQAFRRASAPHPRRGEGERRKAVAKGRRIGIGLVAILGASPVAMAADGEVELKAMLRGFEEVPAVSTTASGTFRGEIDGEELSIRYTLSYSGLEGTVTQAHIHLGQRRVSGGVVVFLCQTTLAPDPTGLAPTCPQSGTVGGTLTRANVTNRADAQGIESTPTQGSTAGEFAELVSAIRAGVTYANVHSINAGGVTNSKFSAGEIRGQIRTRADER